MNRILRTAIFFFVLLLLNACGTVNIGRDFDIGMFAGRIEQGISTRDQVRSWLGEPSSTGVSIATDGERFEEWAYYFAEGEMNDMSAAKVKILQIKFDKQGKARSYNWSASRR